MAHIRIIEAHEAGLDDRGLLDVISIVAYQSAVSRMAHGLAALYTD
jgi:hypothetical protein